MKEILWHGRGGQGAFTASRLLGAAFTSQSERNYAIAFPSFGPERRGAPVRAFNRIADRMIGDRSVIARADYVLYLDQSLLTEDYENELKSGGLIFVNSKDEDVHRDERIIRFDASGLGEKILGLPTSNTAILGFWAGYTGEIALDSLISVAENSLPSRIRAKNIEILKQAYESGNRYER